MTDVVVDASALAALLFDEPDADSVRRRLQGRVLHSTTLLDYELANTAWKKLRRRPADSGAVLAALHLVSWRARRRRCSAAGGCPVSYLARPARRVQFHGTLEGVGWPTAAP